MNEFEKVYEEHVNMVYKICLMYLKKQHDAEEATQETFMKYLKYLPNFENVEHEKRWFIKVSSNICKNIIKSSWFKRVICLDIIPEASDEKVEIDVWEEVINLPYKYKITIYLFYYEGYKTEEISKILDINPSTVRSNLHRARKILKMNLEGLEDE